MKSISAPSAMSEADAPNPCKPLKTPQTMKPVEGVHMFGVQEVPSSNLGSPTKLF
jgi:hypothetical protein